MKKLFVYLFLVVCFLFPNCNVTTAAPNYNIQYLENGDYIITEIYTSDATSRTPASKSKKASYYSQDHIFIFSITISASFPMLREPLSVHLHLLIILMEFALPQLPQMLSLTLLILLPSLNRKTAMSLVIQLMVLRLSFIKVPTKHLTSTCHVIFTAIFHDYYHYINLNS